MDSDDMVPCWAVQCYDCGQFQHDNNWTFSGAVKKWNNENPLKTEAIVVVRDDEKIF